MRRQLPRLSEMTTPRAMRTTPSLSIPTPRSSYTSSLLARSTTRTSTSWRIQMSDLYKNPAKEPQSPTPEHRQSDKQDWGGSRMDPVGPGGKTTIRDHNE